MAIANTFGACLQGPYLARDPTAADRVGGLLEQAGDRLDAAADLAAAPDGPDADVSLFCYEAMFCSIRALVYARGYREAGLRCLVLACDHFYVRDGRLDASHLHDFERAQGLRLTPPEALAAASSLLRRTVELLAS